jgi:hypothetical protein
MRALRELAAGLGLLLQDGHRLVYGRFGARTWWLYGAAAGLVYLWASGKLLDVVFRVIALAIVGGGLWALLRLLFPRPKKGGG